jgi:hypothetical protein
MAFNLGLMSAGRQGFSYYRFRAFFSVLGDGWRQVFFVPVGPALYTLDVNAVNIAFQGKVAPAFFTGFRPDESEHISPFFTIHTSFKLRLIYSDDNLSRVFPELGQHLFCLPRTLILIGGFYPPFPLKNFYKYLIQPCSTSTL